MIIDELLLEASTLAKHARDGRRYRYDRDEDARKLAELAPQLIAALTSLLQAAQPFIENAWIMTDESARIAYGEYPPFQRIALDGNGSEASWDFTIADIERLIEASSKDYR